MRNTLLTIVGTSVAVSFVAGCVPQQKYDELTTAYRTKEQQNLKLQEELDASKANQDMLRSQLADARTYLDKLETMTAQQAKELSDMEGDFSSLSQRITSLRVAVLPPELNAKLTQLHDRYPDLLSFDESTGMLEFSADMSFGMGSTDLSPAAKDAMSTLAQILNSSDANDFDLDIVGHTDNVPVNRPATKKRFPDNMHLSVGRAMAVRAQLVKDSVMPTRVKIGGWGEHRPAKANPSRGGEAANRRVEIFLVPRTTPLMATGSTDTGSTTQAGGSSATEQMDFPPK
ncbi:MAG: OmpA family protein [Planctomycetota bacterium]|nr:OmpA family protein [Planctomycetota bacterium]